MSLLSPLYILAFFAFLIIGVWVYLLAFYPVLLVYIPVFVPFDTVLTTVVL